MKVWLAVSHHLSLIASVGIRNQGTLAGNLMLKHAHNDFPSDVFLSLETVGHTALKKSDMSCVYNTFLYWFVLFTAEMF